VTTTGASRSARPVADATTESTVAPTPVAGWSGARFLPAAVAVAGGALVVALTWGGGAPEPGQPGLPDAGRLTGWALQAVTLLYQLAAVAAVGSLVTGVVLAPPTGGTFHGAGRAAIRSVTWSAAAWAAFAGAAAALTVSEILGVPPVELGQSPESWSRAVSLEQPRALLASAAAAAAVAAYARWVRTPVGGWLLVVTAVLALTPAVFTGHSAQAADHTVAVTSLVVHVVAAALWVGGLLGLVLHLRRAPAQLARAMPVFSGLALVCFVLVGLSGMVNAWTRLDSLAAWGSGYGAIALAKAGAFLLLGVLGWAHRRHAMRRLAAGQPRAFLRLSLGELGVMAATVGLAVALARTPIPSTSASVVAVPAHGPGHDTLAISIEPFSTARLLTEWQPDLIALSLVGTALVLYVRGVAAVTRSGRSWHRARTASFVTGLALVVFATCGGVAVYAPALFSVHVGRFLVLSLVAPFLLVAGRPLRLAELVAPARCGSLRDASERATAALANPVHGAAAYVAVTYALYATPLLDRSLRAVPAHLFASVAALAVGVVLMAALLAPEAPGRRSRLTAVIGVVGFLAVFAGVIASRDALYAPAWFGGLDWAWSDPVTDQRRAALLILVVLPLVTPLLALGARAEHAPDLRPQGNAERR
jgi:cytochrome c oxidase assembly factor CtaG/putative copper export protein